MPILTVSELNQKITEWLQSNIGGRLFGLIDDVTSSSEATADHLFLIARHYRELGHRSRAAASRLVAMEDATNKHLSFICRTDWDEASLAAERLCSRIEDELDAIVDFDPMIIVRRFPNIPVKIAEHHSELLQNKVDELLQNKVDELLQHRANDQE